MSQYGDILSEYGNYKEYKNYLNSQKNIYYLDNNLIKKLLNFNYDKFLIKVLLSIIIFSIIGIGGEFLGLDKNKLLSIIFFNSVMFIWITLFSNLAKLINKKIVSDITLMLYGILLLSIGKSILIELNYYNENIRYIYAIVSILLLTYIVKYIILHKNEIKDLSSKNIVINNNYVCKKKHKFTHLYESKFNYGFIYAIYNIYLFFITFMIVLLPFIILIPIYFAYKKGNWLEFIISIPELLLAILLIIGIVFLSFIAKYIVEFYKDIEKYIWEC